MAQNRPFWRLLVTSGATHSFVVEMMSVNIAICSVVVLQESPRPQGPIYKSLSLSLDHKSLSLSSDHKSLSLDLKSLS